MQEEDEGIVKKLMNGELKAYELAGLVGGESRAAEIRRNYRQGGMAPS